MPLVLNPGKNDSWKALSRYLNFLVCAKEEKQKIIRSEAVIRCLAKTEMGYHVYYFQHRQ